MVLRTCGVTAIMVTMAAGPALALPRVAATTRAAAIAPDAPAANPEGSTEIAGYGKLPNVFTNSLGARFILIKPGKFVMGRGEGQAEATSHGTINPHEVTITRPFYLGETEVTGPQHALKATRIDAPDGAEDGERAAAGTNYYDAIDGILRLSEKEGRRYRLPTEAEWEYAARAGTTTAWYYGNDPGKNHENHDQYEWAGHRGGEKYGDSSRPVAWKKPNPWGLYDMLGNCIEYTSSWCGDYPKDAVTDPAGPQKPNPLTPNHVKRSGGYRYGDNACYARMYKGVDGWRNGRIGYRIAISAADLEPAKDREAFAANIRQQRVANFLLGAAENPANIRGRIKDGVVSGGWGLDIDQAAEYLGKAADLVPKDPAVLAAVDDYLAFLDQLGKAIPKGQFDFAVQAITKYRPKIEEIRQRLAAGR